MKHSFPRSMWFLAGILFGAMIIGYWTVAFAIAMVGFLIASGLLMVANDQDERAAQEMRGADLVITDYREKLALLDEQEVEPREVESCS